MCPSFQSRALPRGMFDYERVALELQTLRKLLICNVKLKKIFRSKSSFQSLFSELCITLCIVAELWTLGNFSTLFETVRRSPSTDRKFNNWKIGISTFAGNSHAARGAKEHSAGTMSINWSQWWSKFEFGDPKSTREDRREGWRRAEQKKKEEEKLREES
mgnify:CR=1 FL=1